MTSTAAKTRAKTKHEIAYKTAVTKLGEREQPPGSNRSPFIDSLAPLTTYRARGVPWCARFVVWAIVVGAKVDYPCRSARAWDHGDDARKRGWRLAPTAANLQRLAPGDLVTFKNGSGHIAIFESHRVVDGVAYVTTIDGNSGDAVARRERPLSIVRDLIAWPEHAGDYAKGRTRLLQVLGGESGRRQLAIKGLPPLRLPSVKEKIT